MALKLTVGVSRKLGLPGYSSVGASCNIEVELDSALLQGDLDGFHSKVREAYLACQQAVFDELARLQSQPALPVAAHGTSANGHDRHSPPENGRGHSNGAGSRTSGAPRSLHQVRHAEPGEADLRDRSRPWTPTWRASCATSTTSTIPRSCR